MYSRVRLTEATKPDANGWAFWQGHLLCPLLTLSIILFASTHWDLDVLLADFFYNLEGHQWALKRNWFTDDLIHQIGKNFSIVLAVVVFACWLASFRIEKLRGYCRALGVLLLSLILGSMTIPLLKGFTHVNCPWEFTRYGGGLPYRTLISQLLDPNNPGPGRCFPAGHATAGYIWVALYFFARQAFPRWRFAALAFGLGLGLVFGFSQQLRGAHFIMHDVWTLTICWSISLCLYWFFFAPRRAAVSSTTVFAASSN
ncbi:phosphatase PAP2 family protein [Pokkaliibacter sp. CJK22405]|uniref:phosphatase PAP2 family protein n=1 Tax=Pokkaliibacter sp. CJK22405 TaxID=3384615 RepID=UPI0039852FD4